jgi:protein tyrosine phosphatase
MQSLERSGKVDILNIVARLREDRGGMVQTQDQYAFVYETLLDYAEELSSKGLLPSS